MELLQAYVLITALLLPVFAVNDDIVWEMGWTVPDDFDLENEPFATPGVIFPGYTFKDTVNVLGRAWQADSPQQIVGLFCINYGPLVYNLTQNEIIVDTCDDFVASLKWGSVSDVKATCVTEWDTLEFGMDENSTLFTMEECYTDAFSAPEMGSVELDYATDIIAGLYSTCPGGYGLGTDRLSAVAFAALDWLGPSILSIATGDTYNTAFAGCSLLRYILSMDMDELIDQTVTLMSYPAADLLEYLQYLQICSKRTTAADHSEGFNLIFDWLLVFTGRNSGSLCTFFSSSNTREDYMAEGTTIAENLYSILTDEPMCIEVMAEIATTDTSNIIYDVTGVDIGTAAKRENLCTDIVTAMTTSSITDVKPYTLPDGVNIDEVDVFSTPGELLPGLNFDNLLAFAGAMYTSTTVTDAVVVVCHVLEDFYVDNDVFGMVDVADICEALSDDDLAEIESLCLTDMFSEIDTDDYYPLALRKFDMAMVGADTARRLLDLELFSQNHVCTALDAFVHSDHNLYSITAFGLEGFLVEGLPSANSICKDYEDVICYLGPYCNPFGDNQKTEQNNFLDSLDQIEGILLLAMGYSSRTSLCKDVSGGIEVFSGRATKDVMKDMRSKILYVMEDSARCTAVLDKGIQVVTKEMKNDGGETKPDEIMYQVTGMNTTKEICGFVTVNFPSYGIPCVQTSLFLTICALVPGFLSWF